MIFTALICDEPHGSHADKDDASEWHDHHKIPFIRMKDCALRWNSFFFGSAFLSCHLVWEYIRSEPSDASLDNNLNENSLNDKS